MSDIKTAYGAKTTIVATLTSLANLAGWQSTVIDNTASKFRDALVRIATNGQTSGTGNLDIYVFAALGDTVYSDGATGTDGAFTAAGRLNAKYLDSVKLNVATQVFSVLRSVAAAFGGVMPDKWGLIFINNSGAALHATAGQHVVEYEGVYDTVL
jgi:hypothetical protein